MRLPAQTPAHKDPETGLGSDQVVMHNSENRLQKQTLTHSADTEGPLDTPPRPPPDPGPGNHRLHVETQKRHPWPLRAQCLSEAGP